MNLFPVIPAPVHPSVYVTFPFLSLLSLPHDDNGGESWPELTRGLLAQ